MVLCRLCGKGSAESSEHIVLDALGGRREVADFLCGTCNNTLGAAIDASFEREMRPFSVLLGAYRGDGGPVAPLRNVKMRDGKSIDLFAGGKPIGTLGPAVQTELSEDGSSRSISISGKTEEEVARLLAHQCRRFGIHEPGKLSLPSTVKSVQQPVPSVEIRMAAGGAAQLRSVAKSGLAALCKAMGRPFVDSAAFDGVVRFVTAGDEALIAKFNSAGGRFALRRYVGTQVGVHVLVVFEDAATSETWALFSPFGAFVLGVRLASQRVGLERPIVHVVDPRAHTHDVRGHGAAPVLAEIRPEKDDQLADMKAAVIELMKKVDEVQNETWIQTVGDKAVEPLRQLPDGTVLQKEHLDAVSNEYADQILMRMTGTPIERDLDPARIWARAKEILDELNDEA